MMRNTRERIILVQKRSRFLWRKRELQWIRGLSALCIVLIISIVRILSLIETSGMAEITDMYGAVLLHQEASGYVLVSVVSFVAAVIFTLICVRWNDRKWQNQRGEKDGKEQV